MTEATWGKSAKTPDINWRMSASLENVARGETEIAEVTNLERAVRDWGRLDPGHRDAATSTTDHPVQIRGFQHDVHWRSYRSNCRAPATHPKRKGVISYGEIQRPLRAR